MLPRERTRWIIERARALGFDLCGVAAADALAELEHLPEWLKRGYGGEMRYLHDPRRLEPSLALEGARSIIVCALNYNTTLPYSTEAAALPLTAANDPQGPRGWISRYAWGDDYHQILGGKLDELLRSMRAEFVEPFTARAYVDTGPVVERVAAKYAGVGWLAKNTCLINEQLGSWLFLGVILTSLDCEPSLRDGEPPPADLCGNCRLCLDACPTGAIVEPYLLDARRCVSYLTIELRGAIPEELRPGMHRMIFGCDICQDVCPWNRKAPVTEFAAFRPREVPQKESRRSKTENRKETPADGSPSLFAPSLEWLASLGDDDFRELFRGSAVKRAKWRGLVRNACVALGNSSVALDSSVGVRIEELLERLAHSKDELIAEHARWALTRLSEVKGPTRTHSD
jgi:epoxyqueuosine reductase